MNPNKIRGQMRFVKNQQKDILKNGGVIDYLSTARREVINKMIFEL